MEQRAASSARVTLLLRGKTKSQTGEFPLTIDLAERPLVIVFQIGDTDLGIRNRRRSVSIERDANVRVLRKCRVGWKDDVDVTVANRFPDLPHLVDEGIVRREIRVSHETIRCP